MRYSTYMYSPYITYMYSIYMYSTYIRGRGSEVRFLRTQKGPDGF